MKRVAGMLVLGLCSGIAGAKLPALSDEGKAKAAEAGAKAAWTDKVGAYQLCKSQDRVAASYLAGAKKAGKELKPVATAACADPGPFAYTPPGAATSPAGNKAPAADAGKKK